METPLKTTSNMTIIQNNRPKFEARKNNLNLSTITPRELKAALEPPKTRGRKRKTDAGAASTPSPVKRAPKRAPQAPKPPPLTAEELQTPLPIEPFQNLKVTTMTIMVTLSTQINLEASFHYLPTIIGDPIETGKKKKGKVKFEPGPPGTIFRSYYQPEEKGEILTRGYRPEKVKPPFRHSISLVMQSCAEGVESKQHNIKLAPESIQITGATCVQDGPADADQLCYYLQTLQDIKDVMNDPQQEELANRYIRTMEWALEVAKGEEIVNVSSDGNIDEENFEDVDVSLQALSLEQDYYLTKGEVPWPDYVDPVLADLFMGYRNDGWKGNYNDYERKLRCLLQEDFRFFAEGPIGPLGSWTVMVNYNYKLGFQIYRPALDEAIRECGYTSYYSNQGPESVIIRMPYVPDPAENYICKKNGNPKHTFTVYKSGSITQSGPGGWRSEETYYHFRECIAKMQSRICLDFNRIEQEKRDIKPQIVRVSLGADAAISIGGH